MSEQKAIELVRVEPPPEAQRVKREARFAHDGEKKTRYALPNALQSCSPVGYRRRVSLGREEVEGLLCLLSLERPERFIEGAAPVTEGELFEECSLGVLSARQSTNYTGHRQVTLGREQSVEVSSILEELVGREADVLAEATHTHVVLSRPYRTPFTMLLTFIGHEPLKSLVTVPKRAIAKRVQHRDDIPTVGYLKHLHLGILADAMERAALIASQGSRRAQVFVAPFCDEPRHKNAEAIGRLERLIDLSAADRRLGWRVALVAQVGQVEERARVTLDDPFTWRRLGANLLAMRSERIQPGVNQEEKAPAGYQQRQEMDVPDELTVMCGRAAYNAFVHWTGCDRELSKRLMLMERIDVLTPEGKRRLREVRQQLDQVTDRVVSALPLWADLATGKALSRNAARGKKAFALAGQRIYVGGLSRAELERSEIGWERAVRAFGASAARSALCAELMGCAELPESCDLLTGICLMAGPINQNDIGKEFYGAPDLLHSSYPRA